MVFTSCESTFIDIPAKGHPFTTLARFGQRDERGNLFLNQGDPQLQKRSLPGYLPEEIPFGDTFSKFTPPAITDGFSIGVSIYVKKIDFEKRSDIGALLL